MRTRILGSLVILGLAWAAFYLVACSRDPRSANITVTGPQVQAVVTTGDRTKLLQAETPLSFATGGNSSSVTISVDESTRFQIIDGFGGSLTDSSAWLIAKK